jgi:hypothetical protein
MGEIKITNFDSEKILADMNIYLVLIYYALD